MSLYFCDKDACGHNQCVTYWNTVALRELTEAIYKANITDIIVKEVICQDMVTCTCCSRCKQHCVCRPDLPFCITKGFIARDTPYDICGRKIRYIN